MKYFAFIAALAICLTGGASAQSSINLRTSETHVTIHNQTGMAVWVTAYAPQAGGGKIEGSWSVKPHSDDTHGLRAHINSVRAEINAGACSGGNRIDARLEPSLEGKSGANSLYRLNAFVRHTGGKCTFTT